MQNTRNKELVSSYLKMHTTLSNAFKETEAVNGMYVKKMDEVTFKEKFESHLKKLATCEDYDVCLTDGSKFNYGTYSEGCPTGTCMELTVDTNGSRMPNHSGKDIYTLLVTDRGIKALGESDFCETGLDCGAYILANHKLYDGTVDEVAPPIKEPTAEELAQQAFEQCKASGAETCTNASGDLLTKVGDEYYTESELPQAIYDQCKTEKGASSCYSECKSANSATCTLANGVEVQKAGDYYVNIPLDKKDTFDVAEQTCASQGMRLPTRDEINNIATDNVIQPTFFEIFESEKANDVVSSTGVNHSQAIWTSHRDTSAEGCAKKSCHVALIYNASTGEVITLTSHLDTWNHGVLCVAD